jgi:RNA-directed DNA polymerase
MMIPDAKVKKYKDKDRVVTRRKQGSNLFEMIKKLNEMVRGFGNYFGVGNVKSKFQRLDEWTRMRVRAFMRKKKSTVSNYSKQSTGISGNGISNKFTQHMFLIQE